MGNGQSQSPAIGSKLLASTRSFSKEEIEDLRSLFNSLAAQSNSNGKFISQQVFQEFYEIDGPLANRLFQLSTKERNDGKLTFDDLIITKATYEKGTRDEIEEFIYQLCDVHGNGLLERDDLECVLGSIQKILFSDKEAKTNNNNTNKMENFLNLATFSNSNQSDEVKSMSLKDFKNWCKHVPSIKQFLSGLLIPPSKGRPGFQIPKLDYPENLDSEILVMKEEYAWHIGGVLSQQETEEWKLLYHSSLHGSSFNTFLGNISNREDHTIFIVKDKEGYIYGGYASQPWEKHSDFYGDMKSFLFQLYPQASIYRPTGANSNLQWFGVGFTSESLPNGIGFGGKTHHFGLFISANFDQGQTFECTTFNSPPLSKTSNIKPDVIECWGVKLGKGLQNESNEAIKGTVLERFKEDRNMLKLIGLASSSE